MMASLSNIRAQQQQRQQSRRPSPPSAAGRASTSPTSVNEPEKTNEVLVSSPVAQQPTTTTLRHPHQPKKPSRLRVVTYPDDPENTTSTSDTDTSDVTAQEVAPLLRTTTSRLRRQPSVSSTLRITNPDFDENTVDRNTSDTSTNPDFAESTKDRKNSDTSDVSFDLVAVDDTSSIDAPDLLLKASVYQPTVPGQPNYSLPLRTSTLRVTNPDPFDSSTSSASLARSPLYQQEEIKSTLQSSITSEPRHLINPETRAQNQIWTMPNGNKVPQPGPARNSKGGGPDEWLEQAKQCKYLSEADMKQLCEILKEYLMEESNIQPVRTPVTICGDIHGQFFDLLELFRVAGGMPNDTNVEGPTVPTKVITSDDIEPPSTITDPKLRKKLKKVSDSSGESGGSSEVSTDVSDDDEEERGRSRGVEDDLGMNTGGSKAGFTAAGDQGFIFLGDFVDRGYFSLETFTLLMCLKAKYPDRITLIRGNHESRQITQVYGFYEECQAKYGNASVWKACCQVFDFLPLAAVVDGKVLCVHGGLSPEIRTLDQVRVVARAQEIPHEGAFCDLVWSDPEDVDTWAVSPRGAGWLFGDKVATEFNHVNGLSLIARAHQLVNEGFKYHFKAKDVVTVWSAPNYCYRCGNVASIMNVDEDINPKFAIFSAVPDDQRAVPTATGRRTEYFL